MASYAFDPLWLAVFRRTGVHPNEIRISGGQVLFEHPWESSQGGRAFGFDPNRGVFFDRHRDGREACLDEIGFIRRTLLVPYHVARVILQECRLQVGNSAAIEGFTPIDMEICKENVSAKSSSCLSRLTVPARQSMRVGSHWNSAIDNGIYRRTVELRTALVVYLHEHSVPGAEAIEWWDRRGWSSLARRPVFANHILLPDNTLPLMDAAARHLGLSDDERVLTGFWIRRLGGRGLQPYFWSSGYKVLFPCWLADGQSNVVATGFRIRQTSSREIRITPKRDCGPKEPSSTMKYCGEISRFRANIGLFLPPVEGINEQLASGFLDCTVIVTEGISDMYSGTVLIQQISSEFRGRIICVTSGSIGNNLHDDTISLLDGADNIVVAYNDDAASRKTVNTGKISQERLLSHLGFRGISAQALPVECLFGENDLNDLLKKSRSDRSVLSNIHSFFKGVICDRQ